MSVSKEKGSSSSMVMVFFTPVSSQRWMRVRRSANSAIFCRQPPQGGQSGIFSAITAISTIFFAPPMTMAPMAVHSAHQPWGKAMFSILAPL